MTDSSQPQKIVVIGAGGLGTPVCFSLAKYFSTKGAKYPAQLLVIDHDMVELSNLNRQILFLPEDIGEPKAISLIKHLHLLVGDSNKLRAAVELITTDTIARLLSDATLIIDCTDSPKTKFLINDFAVIHEKPLLYAGVSGSSGNIMPVVPGGACLRCLFGNFSEAELRTQTGSCRHTGVFGAFVGAVGLRQGQLAIEQMSSTEEDCRRPKLERYTFANFKRTDSIVRPDPQCPLGCSKKNRIHLDLTPIHCPDTFLYTKLALEKCSAESVLDVRLGSHDIVQNVLQSTAEEGYIPLGDPISLGNQWALLFAGSVNKGN